MRVIATEGQRGEHSKTESEGLTRASLTTAEYIATGDGVWQSRGLNRERLGDVVGSENRCQLLAYTKGNEAIIGTNCLKWG